MDKETFFPAAPTATAASGLRESRAALAPGTRDAARLARLKTRRKLWLEVHLWLGLSAGLVLFLVALTGSILVFWQEIDGWLNPGFHRVAAPPQGRAAYLPLEDLVKAADAAAPAGATRGSVYYPRHENQAFWIFYKVSRPGQKEPERLNVFVDPYTGKARGPRIWVSRESIFDDPLVSFLFALHYDLLLGWERGSWIVGTLGILASFSVLTGLIVWWPLTGKWRQSLSFKRRASAERCNYDLHKLFGIYAAPVLLAVLVSGVYFNFGDQFRWLVDRFSPTLPLKAVTSAPVPGREPISLDAAIARVERKYPGGRWYWFDLPNTPEEAYVLTRHEDFGGLFRGRRQFVVDRYSGEILHVADPLAGGAGNVFLQWQWPLHSGQALRMPGRILVLVSGFACCVLFVTGVIRWLQKRRGRRNPARHHRA